MGQAAFFFAWVLLAIGAWMMGQETATDRVRGPMDDFVEDSPEPASVPGVLPQAVRHPRAMVAAAHPLAAKIGVDVLKAGGNAIDATVAVQMALTVLEPQSSGIGGGCFILFWDAKAKAIYAVDGREETPRLARREDFLDEQGKLHRDRITGGACVGVPGTVAAMHLAHARWGKLPWDRVLQPAIDLAEQGVGMSPRLRWAIESQRRRLARFPASRTAFFHPDGSIPEISELRRYPDLARTLRLLAEQGPRVFYEGEIARRIVQAVNQAPYRPGRLTLDDLRQYRAVYRTPLRMTYRDMDVVGMPSPSSGMLTLGMMLGMLEPTETAKLRALPPSERLSLFLRLENTAFADRNAYLGDADWSPWRQESLLDRQRLLARREAALALAPGQRAKAGPAPGSTDEPSTSEDRLGAEEGTNTTHFSIVDADRNVVSCTTTIEHGMGSGLVVPGGGFLLNNELTDFDLDAASGPNALETDRRPRRSALGAANTTGGKRPRSSMCPIIVFRGQEPIMALGSPGGAYIIGIVAHCFLGVAEDGLDMQAAINLPRVSGRNRGPIELEMHFPRRAELVGQLEKQGWKVKPMQPGYEGWGGAHGIVIRPDGTLEGGADPRREGAVRGY